MVTSWLGFPTQKTTQIADSQTTDPTASEHNPPIVANNFPPFNSGVQTPPETKSQVQLAGGQTPSQQKTGGFDQFKASSTPAHQNDGLGNYTIPIVSNPTNDGLNSTSVAQTSFAKAATDVVQDDRTLTIGTFNIQVFGTAKLGNSSVMNILVSIGLRFDLLVIQEIRSQDDVVGNFVQMMNDAGFNYKYYLGPRQGYSVSKEQYAFIYDADKLRMIDNPFVPATQEMARPPLVGRFQSTEAEVQPFTFCVATVHTDPDTLDLKRELRAISDLMPTIRSQYPTEDDFIILGDFNAPTDYIDLYKVQTNPTYIVQENWVTNTRENKNYDNIIFDSKTTTEYVGRSGVFNFRREYELQLDDALLVSDHYPVWAMFSIFEKPDSALANQPAGDFRR